MKQQHQQTIKEVTRLLIEQPSNYEDEVICIFSDLTQIESLYVAAEVSRATTDPDLLVVAICGQSQVYAMESSAMPLVREYDASGVQQVVLSLSRIQPIAAIPLVAMLHKLRGIGKVIAQHLETVSNDQFTEAY